MRRMSVVWRWCFLGCGISGTERVEAVACTAKRLPREPFSWGADEKSSSNGLIYKRSELRFAECSHFGGGELAFVEDHEGGNAANAEFAGDVAVVVHIELGDLEFAIVGRGHFVQGGGDHFAGAAPFGPEIDEHGLVGLQNVSLEAGIGDVFDEIAGHKNSR
jgi:hypothetical protein